MMLAAELGDRESLRLLLEAGATVNCKVSIFVKFSMMKKNFKVYTL